MFINGKTSFQSKSQQSFSHGEQMGSRITEAIFEEEIGTQRGEGLPYMMCPLL